MKSLILTSLALAVGSAGAVAQTPTTFDPPEGCEIFATVQMKGCIVTNLFRCEGDPEGHTRRADFDDSGLIYAGLVDSEAQWLESYFPASNSFEVLVPNPADPASFTDLLNGELDTYDFEIETATGERIRFVGYDRISGPARMIDGVEVLPTEYDIRIIEPDGSVSWRSFGEEYVHAEWRIFLSGVSTSAVPGQEPEVEDNTPLEFIFPGETGFASDSAKHECGLLESAWRGQP